MKQEKILFVDDDRNLLESLKRQLRKRFHLQLALGPKEGLVAISRHGPFAVIVSDLRMPVMDGIQFLERAGKMTPNSVRIMLTGNADLQNAIEAVNRGNIYRFLTKPCPIDTLVQLLDQGIQQYRLVMAEKELLEKTLRGNIQMLTDLMSMLNPELFGRASIIRQYAHDTAIAMGADQLWKIDTAAMLSQIGSLTLPETLVNKIFSRSDASDAEMRLYESHSSITAELLSHIPRMEEITAAIQYQSKRFDGTGPPADNLAGEKIPLGARILKVVSDFEMLESKGQSKQTALQKIKRRPGHYDPAVIEALETVIGFQAESEIIEISLPDLVPGMIFHEDVRAVNGRILITHGHQASAILIQRLKNYNENTGIEQPLKVRSNEGTLQQNQGVFVT